MSLWHWAGHSGKTRWAHSVHPAPIDQGDIGSLTGASKIQCFKKDLKIKGLFTVREEEGGAGKAGRMKEENREKKVKVYYIHV